VFFEISRRGLRSTRPRNWSAKAAWREATEPALPGASSGDHVSWSAIAPWDPNCFGCSLRLCSGVVDDRWSGISGSEESPNTWRQHAARKRGQPPVKITVDGQCHRKYTVPRKRDKGEKAG